MWKQLRHLHPPRAHPVGDVVPLGTAQDALRALELPGADLGAVRGMGRAGRVAGQAREGREAGEGREGRGSPCIERWGFRLKAGSHMEQEAEASLKHP